MNQDAKKNMTIPAELAVLSQWVCWGAPGKSRKCPYDPRSGYPAKAGQPRTWAPLVNALEAVEAGRFEGVGFEFNAGGIVGVDFDHCIKDGRLDPWAAAWVERLNSYTEISPSGTGLHIFCLGTLPGPAVKRPEAEMYDRARYFTVTGRPWGGAARPMREAQAELEALYAELQQKAQQGRAEAVQSAAIPASPPGGPDYLRIGLDRDGTFAALYRGDRPNGNESADDMALLNKLAYWCNRDPEAMRAAFLGSWHFQTKDEAHKKKAQRKDYLPRSIQRAIQDCARTAAEDNAEYMERRPGTGQNPPGDVFGRTEYTGQPKQPPAVQQLSTISARELQDKEIPPTNFIVAELLPQGLALLASPPKYGKSWFVLDLCLSVAAGERFLNHATVKRGCLYLALEDSERRLQDRMNKILQGERAPMSFDYATSAADIGHGLIQQLADYVSQHKDTGLIVVDTLQKVRTSTNGKESAYSADYKETALLKNFADKHSVCVLLVHHLRKAKDDTDPFNQISGTNGIFGAADTALVMTRLRRGDSRTTLSVVGRDIDSGDFTIVFDKDDWKWKNLGSVENVTQQLRAEEYRQSPVVITIRELLRQNPTGTWSGSMKQLLEAGQVITGTWIATSPRELSGIVKKIDHDLFALDRIMHRTIGNGTGGKKHWFGLSTVGSLPETVGGEQQSM